MVNITKTFLITLFAFMLLSCNGNADSQGATGPQEAVAGNTAEQETDSPESTQVSEVIPELTNLTLIPSVEPELLRNVMPTGWHRLERLTQAEELVFIKENINALLEIERGTVNVGSFEFFSIYREQAGVDIFYRVIVTTKDTPDFMSPAISFDQILIHQNTILLMSSYGRLSPNQVRGWVRHFQSLDIIANREQAIGVMITTVDVDGTDAENPQEWSRTAPRRNGQLFGRNGSRFYLMTDLLENDSDSGDRSPQRLSASNSLAMPESPLRYSLQNAFDGNPSTSFVANDENEMMVIRFNLPESNDIIKIAMINGHSKNIDTYNAHSRIRKIGLSALRWNEPRTFMILTEVYEHYLTDGYMTHQFLYVAEDDVVAISVLDYYRGDRYHHVALSELNIMTTTNAWLFGGIDE